MKPAGTPTSSSARRHVGSTPVPTLKSLHPAAARWISAIIRVTSAHPAMTRILDVIERLSDRPYRTSYVLLGEPGTGKEGLARAIAHLTAPGGPVVRFDVAGFPEEDALDVLCGAGRRGGVAEAADGGTILIEETAGLGARVQAALLRLLKSGRCERRGSPITGDGDADGNGLVNGGSGAGGKARRLDVRIAAISDRDLAAEVAAGRFRHDLYYRLARLTLWLPPLRERTDDIGAAAIWIGNRILETAGVPHELLGRDQLRHATADEKARAIELEPEAIRALEAHTWPGNFRELEAVLERALMLYRRGVTIGAAEINSALGESQPSP